MSQDQCDYEAGYDACDAGDDFDPSQSTDWQQGYTDCAMESA